MIAEESQNEFRILMLISDTGGGHRASADALATMLQEVEPRVSIEIVDVWTNYGLWPFNTFVPAYKYLCDHPHLWKLLYEVTMKNDYRVFVNVSGYALCSSNFRTLFKTVNPHLVCSLHPLCQYVPIKTLKEYQPGEKLSIIDLFKNTNVGDSDEAFIRFNENMHSPHKILRDKTLFKKPPGMATQDTLDDLSKPSNSLGDTEQLTATSSRSRPSEVQDSKSNFKSAVQATEIFEKTIHKNRIHNNLKHRILQNNTSTAPNCICEVNSVNTKDDAHVQDPLSTETSLHRAETLNNSVVVQDPRRDSQSASRILINNDFSSKTNVRVPFVTVVTDLGSAHPFWFSPESDLCFVPSNQVHATASSLGLEENQIRQHGLPVRKAFSTKAGICKKAARNSLNLDEDIPICLLIAGGEGAGNLDKFAKKLIYYLQRILSATMPLQVVIICGKNEAVKSMLEDYFAQNPARSPLASQSNRIEKLQSDDHFKNNQEAYEIPTCYLSESDIHASRYVQKMPKNSRGSSRFLNKEKNTKKKSSTRNQVNCVDENTVCIKRVPYSFPLFFPSNKHRKKALSFLLRNKDFSKNLVDDKDDHKSNLEKKISSPHTFPTDQSKIFYKENAALDTNFKENLSFPSYYLNNDHSLEYIPTNTSSSDESVSSRLSSDNMKQTFNSKDFSTTKASVNDRSLHEKMSAFDLGDNSQTNQFCDKYTQNNPSASSPLRKSFETIRQKNHQQNKLRQKEYVSTFYMQDREISAPLRYSNKSTKGFKCGKGIRFEKCQLDQNNTSDAFFENANSEEFTRASKSPSWIESTLSNFYWSSFWKKFNFPSVDQKTEHLQSEGDPYKKSPVRVRVLSFVSDMATWMAAADMIVTKAGPGTIAEACIMGLPILLYCYLPGQEEGNVKFVTESGIGVYSKNPSILAGYIKELLEDSQKRTRISEKAQTLMNPKASLHIAQDIVKILHLYSKTHLKYNNEKSVEIS